MRRLLIIAAVLLSCAAGLAVAAGIALTQFAAAQNAAVNAAPLGVATRTVEDWEASRRRPLPYLSLALLHLASQLETIP